MPNTSTLVASDAMLPAVLRLLAKWQGVVGGVFPQSGADVNGTMAVHVALHVAEATESTWRLFWDRAQKGEAEALHVQRAEMLGVGAVAVETVEELLRLATEAGCDAETSSELETLSSELSRKLAYRSARWQTAEDLEDLSAESLVPSDEELRAIRDSLPFPQPWLEPDEKPF